MTENAGNELSDRDLRDQAAGKVLDWLEVYCTDEAGRGSGDAPDIDAEIRLLAEHAQRESSLDRMVEAFEERYRNRPVAPPVVSIGEVDRMAARLEGHRTAPIPAREVEAGGAMLRLLAGELIAQDRRLADLRLKLDPFRYVAEYLESETEGFDDRAELSLCVRNDAGEMVELTSLLTFARFRRLIDGEPAQAVETAIKDGEGREIVTVDYLIETGSSQLRELCDALGFPREGYNETLKDLIDAAVACTCQGGFVQDRGGAQLRADDCPTHGVVEPASSTGGEA